jgi:hypothetical protein
MKMYFIFLLVLMSCSSPARKQQINSEKHEDLELIFLKPIKPKGSKVLGTLSAQFYTENGSLIQEKSGLLGDCLKCERGVSVKGFLGLRVEGMDLKSFTVGRKQSPFVDLIDCSQDMPISSEYSCKFKINKVPYSLKMSVQ